MKWLQNNWSHASVIAVVVGAVLLFKHYWGDTSRLAALGSLFGFLVTAILVFITIQYVQTNEGTLTLLKEQWKAKKCYPTEMGASGKA
jgi:hypothetical protein